jgi:hypothetical protein
MNLNNQNVQSRLEQNEIIIRDLLNKLQENQIENQRYKEYCEDLERRLDMKPEVKPRSIGKNTALYNQNKSAAVCEPFVDIDAIGICANIEKILFEANHTLNDATVKRTNEKFISNLFDLVLKQYNSKDVSDLSLIKDSLINKYSRIQKRLNSYDELEEKYKKLQFDFELISSTDHATISDGQTQLMVSNEVDKSRRDMESLQNKVIDQNQKIKHLVAQVEKLFAESHLNIYECPICRLQVTNDINFAVFKEHVSKCDKNKHSCMFCLKVFDQSEYDAYIQHVQNDHN